MPLSKSYLAVVAATGCSDRATLLLSTIDPIGEAVIGAYVVKLRRRLVVPRAPGLAAIHGESRALIDAEENDLRIVRIDPDTVIVIATRRPFEGGEVMATIG